jgi:hypothetical protein
MPSGHPAGAAIASVRGVVMTAGNRRIAFSSFPLARKTQAGAVSGAPARSDIR